MRGQLGFARVVGGCASYRFDLMRAPKCLNLNDSSSPYIVLRELPGFVHQSLQILSHYEAPFSVALVVDDCMLYIYIYIYMPFNIFVFFSRR